MVIIRTEARLFEHLLPLIKEEESRGLKYVRDEDDGIAGRIGIKAVCVRRVYFNDGKDTVTFEDRVQTK